MKVHFLPGGLRSDPADGDRIRSLADRIGLKIPRSECYSGLALCQDQGEDVLKIGLGVPPPRQPGDKRAAPALASRTRWALQQTLQGRELKLGQARAALLLSALEIWHGNHIDRAMAGVAAMLLPQLPLENEEGEAARRMLEALLQTRIDYRGYSGKGGGAIGKRLWEMNLTTHAEGWQRWEGELRILRKPWIELFLVPSQLSGGLTHETLCVCLPGSQGRAALALGSGMIPNSMNAAAAKRDLNGRLNRQPPELEIEAVE